MRGYGMRAARDVSPVPKFKKLSCVQVLMCVQRGMLASAFMRVDRIRARGGCVRERDACESLYACERAIRVSAYMRASAQCV